MCTKPNFLQAIRNCFWPALIGAVLVWFSWEWCVEAWHELQLIRGASTAEGHLVKTYSYDVEGDRGKVGIIHVGIYEFDTPKGRFKAGRESPESKFANPAQIEYLDRDPTINRAQGAGYQTLGEWVWRRIALAIFFLGIVGVVGWSLHSARRDAEKKDR